MKKTSRYGQAIPCDGFSAHKMRLHLNRTDLDSFASLDKKSKLLCYADIVRKEKRTGVLCRVIVHPDHRRQGLGKAFCEDLLNWAKESGRYSRIHLNTFGHNKAALTCHESLGVSYRQGRAKVPESRRAFEGFGNHGQKPALVQ